MFKTYDSTLQAYTEHPPKNHDASLNAWVDSPSAKTFDTEQNAWVERLYQGYFTLRSAPTLSADDEFIFTKNEITLFTAKTAEYRRVVFELPIKWAGETIEFDLTKNAIATVSVGVQFKYGIWTSSGQRNPVSDAYDGTYSLTLDTCPDEYEGQTVTDYKISIEIYISADNASSDIGYVNIKNLKFNGKKYGFTE